MSAGSVLIGIPDEQVHSKQDSWQTNKIGGLPDVFDNRAMKQTCHRCGKIQFLAIQVYCPLQKSEYHRTIYVLCCLQKECWSKNDGWTVLRHQHLEVKQNVAKPDQNIFAWNDTEDDWGDDGETNCDEVGIVTLDVTKDLRHLTINGNTSEEESTVSCSQVNEQSPCFTSYYINVFGEEDLGNYDPTKDSYIKTLIKDYQSNSQESQVHPETEELTLTSSEPYERSEHQDKNFHKFSKKIGLCREQVVRYCHAGAPLLVSEEELELAGKCERCNEKLSFEFQLMPGLIPFLKHDTEDCVEFGTILIFTCSKSCWDDVTNEAVPERALYLPDPDLKFFKTQRM